MLFWRFFTAALFSWGFLLLSAQRRFSLHGLSRRRVAGAAAAGCALRGQQLRLHRLAAGGVHLAGLDHRLPLSGHRGGHGDALRAPARGPPGMGRAGHLHRRCGPHGGWHPGRRGATVVGPGAGFRQPLIYATWIVLQARLAGERPASVTASANAGRRRPRIPPGDADVAPSRRPLPRRGLDDQRHGRCLCPAAAGHRRFALAAGRARGTWLPLLGLGLVATAIAIQAFYAGVKRIGGARASLISTVEPVYTVVLAMIIFGEHLTTMQVVGGPSSSSRSSSPRPAGPTQLESRPPNAPVETGGRLARRRRIWAAWRRSCRAPARARAPMARGLAVERAVLRLLSDGARPVVTMSRAADGLGPCR